jgi:hypothetical protein
LALVQAKLVLLAKQWPSPWHHHLHCEGPQQEAGSRHPSHHYQHQQQQ